MRAPQKRASGLGRDGWRAAQAGFRFASVVAVGFHDDRTAPGVASVDELRTDARLRDVEQVAIDDDRVAIQQGAISLGCDGEVQMRDHHVRWYEPVRSTHQFDCVPLRSPDIDDRAQQIAGFLVEVIRFVQEDDNSQWLHRGTRRIVA